MPIKIPRPFVRRKSSGNALEEVPNAPAPSFRVFERSPGGSTPWDGTNGPKQPKHIRMYEATENDHNERLFPTSQDEARNRGSGATNNSASTAQYGSAASSARLSSSSTVPSSTDVSNDSHTGSIVSTQRPFQDIPVPPPSRSRGWSLRNAGRNFSFASKPKNDASRQPSPTARPSPNTTQTTTLTSGGRDRATTASSASTATPPRFLEGELDFDDSELNSFGDMFSAIGNRNSRDVESLPDFGKKSLPPVPDGSAEVPTSLPPGSVPPPLNLNKTRDVTASPHSWASHDSRDGLMGSPSPTHIQSYPNLPSPVRRKLAPSSQSFHVPQPPSSPPRGADRYAHGQSGASHTRNPASMENNEATRLLASPTDPRVPQPDTRSEVRKNFALEKANADVEDISDNDELLFSTSSPSRPNISRTAPGHALPPNSFRQRNTDAVDPSLADSVRVAAQFETHAPAQDKPAKKVMTPAQFERYRQQQELSRKKSDVSEKDDSDAENDNYDDEDEAERGRQAAKQRRKQEAHLAVYRQTMMKVTGEPTSSPSTPADQSGRLTSMSTPELSRMSHLTADTGVSSHSRKSSGTEGEDEDVPLGILAAHGFPNKNKPPNRLETSLPSSNLGSPIPVSAPAASVSGESRAGSRGNLPVFARNLPQDPYYGASLVNPPNREQLSMGGGQSFGGVSPGHVHPSGLVGVIAGEERAKAMRRASPSQQAYHESLTPPGIVGRSQTTGTVPTLNGYPGPGMTGMAPQALSPGDQAQIQMAQQMSHMMQMQMQWMQQMTQMHQSGGSGQMPQPLHPGMKHMQSFPGMPGETGNPSQRPFSVPLPESPRQNGRATSLIPEMAAQWNRNSSYVPSLAGGQGGYAPSIAPSERNNIGMASRYRPVSIAAEPMKPANATASTFTSSTFQPWTQDNEQGRLSPSNTNSTIRPPSGSGLRTTATTTDDEDDDLGWAEMKQRRDKKRGMWKTRRNGKSGD